MKKRFWFRFWGELFCEIAAHLENPGYLGAVHVADDINLFPFVGKRPICQLPQSLLSKNPLIDCSLEFSQIMLWQTWISGF